MSGEQIVEGLADLDKALQNLTVKAGTKALRAAGRKAMQPVLDDAVQGAEAHRDTGDLVDSLGIKSATGKKGETAMRTMVGNVKKKASKLAGGRKLQGTGQRLIALEYGNRQQEATPILVPALEQNINQVLGIYKTELAAGIEKGLKS